MTLKPGDKVYVVLQNLDDDSWAIIGREVLRATDRQISLRTPFPSMFGIRFKPHALGLIFHASERDAVKRFVKNQREVIASANRKIITATKALHWARSRFSDIEDK